MIVKAIVRKANEIYDQPLIVPICLPDLDAVKRLAFDLHQRKEESKGEFAGWDFHYSPMRDEAPIDSRMKFTPASFFLGAWPIWSVSFDWEKGDDQDPYITVWDKQIVKQ